MDRLWTMFDPICSKKYSLAEACRLDMRYDRPIASGFTVIRHKGRADRKRRSPHMSRRESGMGLVHVMLTVYKAASPDRTRRGVDRLQDRITHSMARLHRFRLFSYSIYSCKFASLLPAWLADHQQSMTRGLQLIAKCGVFSCSQEDRQSMPCRD